MSEEAHVSDLLPAYALGCLDNEEAIQVEKHLATCSVCRAELTAYQEVADQLALAATDALPPSGLKKRLLDACEHPTPSAIKQPGPAWWQSLIHLLRRPTPTWSLVGIALILILAVSNVLLWQQINRLEPHRPAENWYYVPLSGTDAAPNASGTIVISSDGEYGTLVVEHLPPLDQEQAYQLWLIRDGQRTSGGLFSVDSHGYRAMEIMAPEPLSDYTAFGITIEPAGGSPGPSGAKVLGGDL